MILSLIFSFLITHSALAAKCPGADVSLDQSGGSMEFVKPRYQEKMNTCYAFAAAEVWDAYRFSHYDSATLKKEKDFYTIPMQGALAVNLQKGSSAKAFDWNASGTLPVEKGGDPAKTLKYFMTHPTCVSSKTTDELFTDLPGKTRPEKIAYLQSIVDDGESTRKLFVSYQNKAKGKDEKILASLQSEYDKKYQEILKEVKSGEADTCFKNGSLDKFLDEYMKIAQFSENSISNIHTALLNACERKSAPVKGVSRMPIVHGLDESNNIMKDNKVQAALTIHQALSGKFNKPIQPVMIGTCDNFLYEGKNSDRTKRDENGRLKAISMGWEISTHHCKAHALVLVGRKTEGNSCKILIRNSLKNCKEANYSPDWKCDEQGDDVWVDQETLINNTLNYSFIKD